MAPNMSQPAIIRIDRRHGAPTGESDIYVTEDGREWRSTPSGHVQSANAYGRVTGGKFAARVVVTGGR